MFSQYLGPTGVVFELIMLGFDLLFALVIVVLAMVMMVRAGASPKIGGLRLVGGGLLLWGVWIGFSAVIGQLFGMFYGWERFQYEWGPFYDAILTVTRHGFATVVDLVALALVVGGSVSTATALAAAPPDPAR
jgi:hypothetical protein